MSDDRLGDALRLRDGRVDPLQEIEGEVSAVELEAEAGGGEVCVGGADVVEEAGEEVGFGGEGPGGEVLGLDGLAW